MNDTTTDTACSEDTEDIEALFRCVVENGRRVFRQVPLTHEALLNPVVEDQLSQSRPHQRTLYSLTTTLANYLERDSFGVYSQLMILWERLGERNVVPDIFVAKRGFRRSTVGAAFDPVKIGAEPCLIIEIVSTSCRILEEKDTQDNPPLFARRGVEDLLLVYPPFQEEPMRLDARRLTPWKKEYEPNLPGEDGWTLLRSVNLQARVSDDEQHLLLRPVLRPPHLWGGLAPIRGTDRTLDAAILLSEILTIDILSRPPAQCVAELVEMLELCNTSAGRERRRLTVLVLRIWACFATLGKNLRSNLLAVSQKLEEADVSVDDTLDDPSSLSGDSGGGGSPADVSCSPPLVLHEN